MIFFSSHFNISESIINDINNVYDYVCRIKFPNSKTLFIVLEIDIMDGGRFIVEYLYFLKL